jgi:hypothetical protein
MHHLFNTYINRYRSIVRLLIFRKKGGYRDSLGSFISPLSQELAENVELNEIINPLFEKLKPRKIDSPLKRLGSKLDGGYVVVDQSYTDTYMISGGIETNNDFEMEFAQKGGSAIQIDYSVNSAPNDHPNLEFEPWRLVGEGAKESPNDVTLDELYEMKIENSKFAKSKNILKLDIEGSEWDILLTSKMIDKFDQILLELHYLERLGLDDFKDESIQAINRILEFYFPVVITGNNCCGYVTLGGINIPRVLEMTLLNRKNYFPGDLATPNDYRHLVSKNYESKAPLTFGS